MEYLLNIVRVVFLSLVTVVVCFLLGIVGFILIYGDKGREDPALPPRSRWQLLRIFVCEAIPRLFAVLVLRQPLTEEEARYARMQKAERTDGPASASSEATELPPERSKQPEMGPGSTRSGTSRYADWLRQRRRRKDKTD